MFSILGGLMCGTRCSEGQDHVFAGPKVGRISMPVWSMISDVSFEFKTIYYFFWILASVEILRRQGCQFMAKHLNLGFEPKTVALQSSCRSLRIL